MENSLEVNATPKEGEVEEGLETDQVDLNFCFPISLVQLVRGFVFIGGLLFSNITKKKLTLSHSQNGKLQTQILTLFF